MAPLALPPDYFRTAAELYQAKPSARKAWLADQVAKASASLLEYQRELNDLALKIVKVGGAPSDAKAMTIVGGVVAAVPTGYTQIVGGVLIIAASFFAKSESKQKAKEVEKLRLIGLARNEEAMQVAAYKSKYQRELLVLRLTPVVLTLAIIWLIWN